MNSTLTFDKIESLPAHLKKEVNDFVDFLLDKELKKNEIKKPTDISKFYGIISDEEGAELMKIIEDGCGKIDYDGWK